MSIILASASPRRLEILKNHGIEPVVMPTGADETLTGSYSMTEAAEEISKRKARACYDYISSSDEMPGQYRNSIIVAADTIVYKDGIYGKPADKADAKRMLLSYRKTFHYVVTGITLIDMNSGDTNVMSDVTKVWCGDYGEKEIEDYISLEQPYDKAGSYAIQGYFGRYIEKLEGDRENVIGLPYYRIKNILKKYL